MVYSDGSTWFSRPGTLEVVCRFSGLVAFPFDNPVCLVDIGGWALSGHYQGISLMGQTTNGESTPGYEISDQEVTSGSSYQEYLIESMSVEVITYYYASFPNEVCTPGHHGTRPTAAQADHAVPSHAVPSHAISPVVLVPPRAHSHGPSPNTGSTCAVTASSVPTPGLEPRMHPPSAAASVSLRPLSPL